MSFVSGPYRALFKTSFRVVVQHHPDWLRPEQRQRAHQMARRCTVATQLKIHEGIISEEAQEEFRPREFSALIRRALLGMDRTYRVSERQAAELRSLWMGMILVAGGKNETIRLGKPPFNATTDPRFYRFLTEYADLRFCKGVKHPTSRRECLQLVAALWPGVCSHLGIVGSSDDAEKILLEFSFTSGGLLTRSIFYIADLHDRQVAENTQDRVETQEQFLRLALHFALSDPQLRAEMQSLLNRQIEPTPDQITDIKKRIRRWSEMSEGDRERILQRRLDIDLGFQCATVMTVWVGDQIDDLGTRGLAIQRRIKYLEGSSAPRIIIAHDYRYLDRIVKALRGMESLLSLLGQADHRRYVLTLVRKVLEK